MSFNSLNNKPEDVVKAWKETRKLAEKLKKKLNNDDELENRATLECIVCGSVLHGEEPRIQIVCDDCKDVRFSPLPPMSPFTNK
tara:strand:+ start:128 stop:379 length:252 start_codon:yes stop_codon:yes gene_type:complete